MTGVKRVIAICGPAGCGKGAQSDLLAGVLKLPSVSASRLLRAQSDAGATLGASILQMMRAELLVPDQIVNRIVSRRLASEVYRSGFVVGGYPRTAPQAEHFDRLLARLNLPTAEVVELRVSLEQFGERHASRGDDGEKTVRERFWRYASESRGVLDYYRGQALYQIDAWGPPEDVLRRIKVALGLQDGQPPEIS